MNADRWREEFAGEKIFMCLDEAGFECPLRLLPADARGTHPSARYGDSTLDYVFCRGFSTTRAPIIVPNEGLSDHRAVSR